MLIIVCVVFPIVLVVAYSNLQRSRKAEGVHDWIHSQDVEGKGQTFIDSETGIAAKPDIVLLHSVGEIKNKNAGSKPFKSDLLQVGAELIASGKEYATRHYLNREFEIYKDRKLIDEVANIKIKMHFALENRASPEATPTKRRCAVCDFGNECPESLNKLLKED